MQLTGLNDINCDIRCSHVGLPSAPSGFLPNIDCDIRVFDAEIYDINCDIRVVENGNVLEDINCDIRVRQAGDTAPTAIGLDGFRVYLNSVEIEDVEVDSIRYEWSKNETPANAQFRIVRKSDNFNKTLEAISQAITANLPVEIKFNDNLRYYGYVMSIDVNMSGESANVKCLDRKHKIQQELYDISYGRKWEAPEPGEHEVIEGDYLSTANALTYILGRLVTAGIISSYSGVPSGVITEYNESEGMPAGQLITELLNESGNYYWNVTPSGVLEIYRASSGTLKELPLQRDSEQIHLYDVLDYTLKINDISNLITTLEVHLGTESEEVRASYKSALAYNLSPAWDRGYDTIYNYGFGLPLDKRTLPYEEINRFRNQPVDYEKAREVGRKWQINAWTEGSFIDESFKAKVLGFYNNEIKGWSWSGQYLTLSKPLLKVKNIIDAGPYGYYKQYEFEIPTLIGRFFRKEAVGIALEPTVFDIAYVGYGGSGSKRKATFTQLGIRSGIAWTAYENGRLTPKSEPGYNDTEYATDRAKLMLSRMNDPVTSGTINITFDAFEYYHMNIGNKVNLTQTEASDIYNGNNGFPLDIESIEFDAGNYNVILNVSHIRDYVLTVNYR